MAPLDAGPASPIEGRAAGCFHCGLPIPPGSAFRFEGGEELREFCCAGCEAVWSAIHGLGLDEYYRLAARGARAPPAAVFGSQKTGAVGGFLPSCASMFTS